MVFIKNSIKRKKVRTISKYSNTIEYSITTKLDAKGLTQLQNQIREVEASLSRLATKKDSDPFNFGESVQQLQKLNKALSSSFDSSLGMLNISKLKTELKDAGVTANQLGQAFSQGGAQGRIAFNNLLGQIGKIDTGLKRTSTTVDKMFNTISNTVRWGVVSSGFSAMLNSLHQSVDYVKELDDSLTQIMLVTDYSRQQMQEYAKSANEAAKSLGATTVDVTRGSQVFAQQGFDLQQSSQLAELSIKLANASEQDSATTSDQITALMNAYGLEGNISELSQALDSWALVANISAADVQELAKASQKAASSASTVGVSLDQMNAQIATIESVTRDAPEQIGNGLKTLYARMSDISLGETLEDGVGLGEVTSTLQSMGVQVLDQAGQMRNVGDIMEDLMVVWDDLDQTSKEAAGQALAGKYQLNRFYALMDNSDMYQQFKEGSTGASGTLDQMNEEYINSMAGRSAKLQATLEGLFNSVFNPDNFYPAIDALTNFVDLINKLVDSIGGGQTVLTGIIALFGRLFSNNIAQSINDTMMNRRMDQVRQENAKNVPALLADLGLAGVNENNQQIIDFAQYMQANQGSMSKEQVENANRVLEENIAATNRWEQALDNVEAEAQQINFLLGHAYDEPTKVMKDANGQWNFDAALTELQGLDKIDSAGAVKKWNVELDTLQEKLFKIAEARDTAFDLNTSTLGVEQAFQKIKTEASEAQYRLDNLRSVLNPEDYMALKQALDTVQQELMEGAPAADEEAESLMNAALAVDELSKRLQGLTFTRDDVKTVTGRATKTLSEANIAQGGKEASDNILSAYQENFDSQKYVKNITDAVAAVGELAFAWQSFQNLGSIWSNSDISDGEKLLQTITNLSFALPSLINGIKTLKTNITEVDWKNLFDDKGFKQKWNLDLNEIQLEKDKIFEEYIGLYGELENARDDAKYAKKGMKTAEKKHGIDSGIYRQQKSRYKNASEEAQFLEKEISDLGRNYDLLEGQEKVIQNFDQLTKKQKVYAVAANAANKVTGLLGGAMEQLSSPIGIAGMAILGLISNMERMKDEAEQANINQLFEDYQKFADNRNIDISEFDKLYDDYKKTGNVSDELINTSKTLGEQLEIVGDQALINAGNFDELSKQIHKASEESDEMAKKAADETINAITGAESQHALFSRDFASKFTFFPGLSYDDISTRTGISYDLLGKDQSGMDALEKYQSIVNALSDANKNLEQYNAQLDEAEDRGAQNGELEWIKSHIAHEEEIRNGLSEALATEDMEKIKAIIDTESKALEESLPEKAKELSDKSLQEVINTFQDSEGNFKYLGEKIKEVTAESGDEAGKEYLLRLVQSLSDAKFDVADVLSNFGEIDPEKVNNNIKEKISKEKLSDEDFKALGFDSAEAFWEAFENALTNKTYTFQPEQFRYSDEKIEEIFKKAKMEDTSVDDYVASFKNLGGAGAIADDEFKTLTERVEELDQAYKQAQEDFEKDLIDKKQLDSAAKSLDNANENLKQFAIEALETSNGLDELSEKWENINDAMQNGSPTEIAGAYSDLKNILSQILNVDPSMITQDFMQNADVLAALDEVANGTADSVWKLREAFGDKDLVLNAYLDTIGFEGDRDRLFELVNIAQAALPDLEAGAYLDDTNFINGLTNLVMQGSIAAADIQKIFDGLGYDVQIDTEPMTFPTVSFEVGAGLAAGLAAMAAGPAAGAAITAGLHQGINFIVDDGPIAQIPRFTFVKKGNPTGGSTYRKNTGGGGGKGGKGSCFVADTLITMHGFYKKIQEIAKGDIVLSYNEITKTNEYSQVVQTMIHATTEEIYTLSIKDEQLRVTGIHRFFIKRNNTIDWIEASNLKVGDLVFLANGTWTKILDILIDIETRYVYNFEVSNNHNYYVGTNRILAHNKGGSGGSGGGGGKGYEMKHKDPIEEEIDLYEKVNTQLDDVEETIKDIQRETDRLIGPKGRANMNQQIKLLQKEIGLQKEKLEIQERERDDLRDELEKYGTRFDSEGFISNYAETLKSLEKKVNDLTNEYNNTTTEEGQEALEKLIDEAKEDVDKFKDLYKRFDELQGKEIKETKNQIEELINSIEDLRIEAYKASQEAIDDLRELRDNAADLLGLFSKYKSDSPFRAAIVDAEKLKNLFGGTKKEALDYYQTLIDKNQELLNNARNDIERRTYQSYVDFFKNQQQNAVNNPLGTGLLGLASQDLERLQGWIDGTNRESNPFGENTAALYEAYEDAYKRMSELAFDSEEAWEQLEEDIIDGYDEIAEKEEEQIDRYDRLTDRLETIADMMGLAYGDTQYADIAKIYDQIGRSTFQQLQDQKTITKIWEKRYDEISDKTSDIAKAVQQHMEEAQDKLIEIQKDVIDAWQKAFENAMKELTAQEYKTILGVRQPDDVSSDWERDKEYANKYYDRVQKANLIEQLRLKYMDLLDDAQGSSLDTQRRIRDAMNEQVDYLEKQGHLSEFNVKYANAQLEILQKQIALEDARNNKNQMRLRRDTQGNYRYVYSANQDDVRGKEADLLQSEFDAYNMSTENRMNTYSDWLNDYQNYVDQREALLQRIERGDQEAADALEKLEADFARDMTAYSEELSDSWEGMVGALQWMTETGNDYIRDMAEKAMEAIQEKTETSLSKVGIQWSETVNNAIYSLNDLLSTHTNITSDMMDQANKYKDIIQNQVTPTVVNSIDDINGATNQAANSTRDLAAATKELNDALASDNAALVENTKKLEDYRKQLDNVKNSSAVTAQQLRKAQAELDQTKAQNLNYKTIIENGFSKGQNVTLKKGTWLWYDRKGIEQRDTNGDLGFTLDKDTTVSILTMHEKSNLNDPNSADAKYAVTVFPAGKTREPEKGGLSPEKMKLQGWHLDERALRNAMLDTGGYTGEWEDGISGAKNGKMAFLHQKELVLNANDTENILQAVKMIRTITDMSKVFSTFVALSKGTEANKLGGDTIEQRVEITAEFPNVQDSAEIETALLNIADSAYQYSYRTR